MTSTKDIFDFMNDLPKFMTHEDSYLRKVQDARYLKEKMCVNMVDFEAASIGMLEQNLLTCLTYDYQFCSDNFNIKHGVKFSVFSKQHDDKYAQGSLKHDSTLDIGFMTTIKKKLAPNVFRLPLQGNDSPIPNLDQVLFSRVEAWCKNIAGVGSNDIAMINYTDKLITPPDLRHMLLKGYLYLCDYNLGTTSNIATALTGPVVSFGVQCDTGVDRLEVISDNDVVIDARHFTMEEVSYINLMGNAYPRIKFAGDNVYNSMMMVRDKLAIIVGEEDYIKKDMAFQSPSDMCTALYSIAMKLGVLSQLREVIKSMRGVPILLDDICRTTESSAYVLSFPKSESYRTAIDNSNDWAEEIGVMSNYYGASISLVADALSAEGLKYQTFPLLEQLASLGPVGLPTGHPATDPVFNSMLRDAGLKHDDDSINSLKLSWKVNMNSKMAVCLGGVLKSYTIKKLETILSREYDAKGLFNGPIAQFICASVFTESTWGAMSGWNPITSIPLKNEQLEYHLKRAYAHFMGITDILPMTGVNCLGVEMQEPRNAVDRKALELAGGHHIITKVTAAPREQVKGRIDAMQLQGRTLLQVHYGGTIGRIIMDEHSGISFTDNVVDFYTKRMI